MFFATVVFLVATELVLERSAMRQIIIELLGGYYFLLLFIIVLGFIISLDRYHDERYKKLVKLPDKASDA
jgi:hypothetical protein